MKKLLQITAYVFLFSSSFINAQVFTPFYNDIVDDVSSANILADLTAFENFGVKDIGSTALSNAQVWIKTRYEDLGYTDIVEQPFTVGGTLTNNIIITKTGSVYPNTFLIIDGHYDTINGPGTNDNGSGTALILEIARLLKDVDTEYSIKFIHFSGEENGLLGSTYYVNNTVIPQSLDISLVFNIDEIGGINGMVNNTIVCERDERNSPSSNNAASAAATTMLANSIELYSTLNTEISFAYASDYIPFENNGEIITGLYEKNETPHAHTANDVLANMDADYVYEITKGALGAALHFAVGIETLSILGNDLKNNIYLYPNPSNGEINIDVKAIPSEGLTLKIVDVLGKEVYNTSIDSQTSMVDLGGLTKGIYLAVFENSETAAVKKIVLY